MLTAYCVVWTERSHLGDENIPDGFSLHTSLAEAITYADNAWPGYTSGVPYNILVSKDFMDICTTTRPLFFTGAVPEPGQYYTNAAYGC